MRRYRKGVGGIGPIVGSAAHSRPCARGTHFHFSEWPPDRLKHNLRDALQRPPFAHRALPARNRRPSLFEGERVCAGWA